MLDRFSIKQKFLLLGAVVAVAGLVVFLQTFNGLLAVKGSVDDYFEHIAQRQELQKQLHANLGYGGAIHRFKNYVLRGNGEDAEAFRNSVQASEALLEDYRGLSGLGATEKQALDTIAGVLDEYRRQLATVTAQIDAGSAPQAIDTRVQIDDTPAIAAFATLAGEFERLNSQHHSALQDNSDNMVVNTLWLVGVVAAVVSVLGVFLVMSITGRLARVVAAMDDVARGDGDLTHRIGMNGNDELSHLARAFNHFVDNIQGVVSHVCDSTLKLQSSAGSLEEITDETNKAVQQQHQEVDQVATAMEQMTATVHEIAGNASQAASATEKADADANKGKSIVGTTITSIRNLANEVESASSVIGSLEEDAASISTVMDVIKTIAEQTNLLALNAAIEAARAGEQGRGFGVVADEVRTLASRTQDSTHEIHEMVERLQNGARNAVAVMEKSSQLAAETVEEVGNAGTSLAQITDAVDIINSMNFQVASASEEQSAVAEEINKNVVRISELAEVSSAGANRTKEASQELQALSAHLQNQVSRFKI